MRILAINVGRVASLTVSSAGGSTQVPSAIVKSAVSTLADARPVAIGYLGAQGDEQADLTVHGGRDKAIYAYPFEHYPIWRTMRMQAQAGDEELPFGAFGENLTIEGLLETEVWIGDVLQFAARDGAPVLARVSAPREPCFKFNAKMGFKQAARMMVQSAYTGFYLEVMQPGSLWAGAEFELVPGERVVRVDEMHRLNTGGGRN